ncbi:FimV/HubP family polar landmark protein [Pseudorhodoferax sp.]|uniref:FimV/HubP family polar landmark protein n=1 Tax=Pseudorhodoferax sp. TaxID=1993553 RepID=UPI0039E33C43
MMIRTPAADPASVAPPKKPGRQGWKRSILAAAVAGALGAALSPAQALTLGRLKVHSALGEPLRAEIELPDITVDEERTLRPSVAGPEAFRAAGLDYNAALAGLRITPQRRPDGRMVLLLSGDRPVSEPFVDLILQADWAAGRVARDYTLLLDPPPQRQAPEAAVTAPQLLPQAPETPAPTPAPAPAQTLAPAAPPPAAPPSPRPAAPVASGAGGSTSVTVRRGDTAGRLAAAHKAPQVSLDQMLVAMLRSNPDAFIDGNVNRLKAGAVLTLPSAEQASGVPQPEAARVVAAQARDFNAYRGRLAAQAPTVRSDAERSASGRVQAEVEEHRPAVATDRLTLSKGGVQGQREEQIAQQKAASEAAERMAELSRNIQELNQLGAGAATGEESTPPAAAPAAEAASAATAPAVAVPPPAVPDDASAPGLLHRNPLLPAAAMALLALLAGLGVYRRRRRAAAASAAAPATADGLFTGSGGKHVDTAAGALGPSDGGGRPDPVAEADDCLARGHDLQAEEILKEALRTAPERAAAIRAKLAQIHARQREAAAAVAGGAAAKLAAAAATPFQAVATPFQAAAATNAPVLPDIVLDLGDLEALPPAPAGAAGPLRPDDALDFDGPTGQPLLRSPAATPPAPGPMPFDLGALSLDLDETPAPRAAPGAGDPLATKLALAEEFRAIGDLQGARALSEEVLAEASGPLRARARRLRDALG